MRTRVLVGLGVALVVVAVALTATGIALAQGPIGNGWRGQGGMMGQGMGSGMMGGLMGGMMGRGMMGPDMGRRPPTDPNQPYDLRFLDEMIAHHQMGVIMTQHMAEDSARPEMRDLAQRIVTAQQREITQMQQWRQQWYPNAPGAPGMGSGMMGPGMMGGMMDRETMGQMMGRSFDFDRMFLLMMIPHHEGAIEMAQTALQQAEHAEIKTLAQAIITTQQAEITEMRGYLRAWYGVP